MSETVYYIICVILSLLILTGISLMSKVKTAVAGNLLSAFSVFVGVVATLYFKDILSAWNLYVFILLGILVGGALALKVKMIEMPQLVALLNGVGGLASGLVGFLTLLGIGIALNPYPVFVNVTSVLAIIIGLITLSGSLVAAGKLHKLLPQKPINWKYHSVVLNILVFVMVAVTIFSVSMGSITEPSTIIAILIISSTVGLLFGYVFAIRVGGADMPITISLLNSLSGVAGAIAGMAVNDILLISVGGIVGASGLFLTQTMCKAMNRSLQDILLGKTSVTSTKGYVNFEFNDQITNDIKDNIGIEIKFKEKKSVDDILNLAKSAIIVPGYGMALAQAQHLVKKLSDKMEQKGAVVKFAIHPVAGRMPGHMNVLLAEADVPYDKLFDMEYVNEEFSSIDIVIVIGANDVINPSARDATDTPIYGMPILNVDEAKEVIICNFDLKPGYAGVDNPLYSRSEGIHMFLGDAKDSLNILLDKFN